MPPKHVFSQKQKKPKIAYCRIWIQGDSKVLAVTKIFPKDWSFVKIEEVENTDGSMMLKVTKVE